MLSSEITVVLMIALKRETNVHAHLDVYNQSNSFKLGMMIDNS